MGKTVLKIVLFLAEKPVDEKVYLLLSLALKYSHWLGFFVCFRFYNCLYIIIFQINLRHGIFLQGSPRSILNHPLQPKKGRQKKVTFV